MAEASGSKLEQDIGSLLASAARLPSGDSPCLVIGVQLKPGKVLVEGTSLGLIRLASYLLAQASGAADAEKQRLIQAAAPHSVPVEVQLVDRLAPVVNEKGRGRLGTAVAIATVGLWVGNLCLWALGLYVVVMWGLGKILL